MRNSVLAIFVGMATALSWGEGLPDGYTQVEYVESTHDQYVKTGYIPNANTTIALKFSVMDYKARNESKDTSLADKNNVYIIGSYNDRCQFSYGDPGFCGFGKLYNNSVTLNGTKDSDVHLMGLTNGLFYVDGAWKFEGGDWPEGGKGKNLYVFCLNANDGSKDVPKYWCAARVYSLVISENEVVKCDFIPAVRNEDGVAGLYDLADSNSATAFHTSATGVPLKAPDDIPEFYEFATGGTKVDGAWASVKVRKGVTVGTTVTCYIGKDPATWQPVGTWSHTVDGALYAATNAPVEFKDQYYAAFKLSYASDDVVAESWTETNVVTIAERLVWTGPVGGGWSDSANWDLGIVPSSTYPTYFLDSTRVVAGAEDLGTIKSAYASKGTVVWDFDPKTILGMTWLHVGNKDEATPATLIVSNGVISATSFTFDVADGSIRLNGTRLTCTDAQNVQVARTALVLENGAELTIPGYETSANSSIQVVDGSVLDLNAPTWSSSKLGSGSRLLIDGGAVTNRSQFSVNQFGDVNTITIRNGGVFAQRPTQGKGIEPSLTIGEVGSTRAYVTDGGLFDVSGNSVYLGNTTMSTYQSKTHSDSWIDITNGTMKCATLVVGRDTRFKANYAVRVIGEKALLDVTGNITLGATSYQGATDRNKGSATIVVSNGTVKVGGELRMGKEHELVPDKLSVSGAHAKVTAAAIVCTTNAVFKFTVPENGFADAVVETTGDIGLSAEKPTPITIDMSACQTTAWQTLLKAGTGIRNLTSEQIEILPPPGRRCSIRVSGNELKCHIAQGLTLIIR